MAGRSSTTFKKREKETARIEKQREKFAKRLERKTTTMSEQFDLAVKEAASGIPMHQEEGDADSEDRSEQAPR